MMRAYYKCYYCGYHLLNCQCEDENDNWLYRINEEDDEDLEEAEPDPDDVPIEEEEVQPDTDPAEETFDEAEPDPDDMPPTPEPEEDPEDEFDEPDEGLDEFMDDMEQIEQDIKDIYKEFEDYLNNPKKCMKTCDDDSPNKECTKGPGMPRMAPWDPDFTEDGRPDSDPPPTDAADNPQPPPTPPPDPDPDPDPDPEPEPEMTLHTQYRQGTGGAAAVQEQTDSYARHDPDGIDWITPDKWVTAEWDGVTTYNPCTLSCTDLYNGIFAGGNINTMRGLRQLYYTVNPFADVYNPKVSEIEAWNLEVIKLFRRLMGFTNETHPVENSRDLFTRAQWSTERKWTTVWNTMYPGTVDSAYGPCTGGTNMHCGATFIPSAGDQIPYLVEGQGTVTDPGGGAEAITPINTNIPWAIKFARIIGTFLINDCITGHTGPFIGRPYVGYAWHVAGASTEFRVKWSGPLVPTCPDPPPDPDPEPDPHVHDVINTVYPTQNLPYNAGVWDKGKTAAGNYEFYYDIGRNERIWGMGGSTDSTKVFYVTMMSSDDCLGHVHPLKFIMYRNVGAASAIPIVFTIKGTTYNLTLPINIEKIYEFDVVVDQPIENVEVTVTVDVADQTIQMRTVEMYKRPDVQLMMFDTPESIRTEFGATTATTTVLDAETTTTTDYVLQNNSKDIHLDVTKPSSKFKYYMVEFGNYMTMLYPDGTTSAINAAGNTTKNKKFRTVLLPITSAETSGNISVGGYASSTAYTQFRRISYYKDITPP